MATRTQMETLRKALSFDCPPLCSGAVSPSPEGLSLYYGKEIPRFIDFASTKSEDLDLLTAACDPATFGRGNEDVYDESYHKAVKMDASNFTVQLDLVGSGLLKTIEDQLLQGETENMYIRAEPYKLNVYEKDSFFKAHKDTPRGKDMVGSLVIIYPTTHEGGELVLRQNDGEWKFDANSLTSAQPSTSLAYVAFYSDIEYEVLRVTSGRRVTVTYNLYLVDPASRSKVFTVTPNSKGASSLQTMLWRLLKSSEFLPDGGTLGFGLVHLYPITFDTKLQEMVRYLKGKDAQVYRACQEFQLQPSLQMIYDDEMSMGCGIMTDEIVHDPGYDAILTQERYENALVRDGGVPVNKTEDARLEDSDWVAREGEEGEFITWISPFNEQNRLQDIAVSCGKYVSTRYIECSPCIIARVAAAIDRV